MHGSSRVEGTRPGTRKDLGGDGVGLPDVSEASNFCNN